MNIQSKPPTTADEFLRWNEGREGKWDFVDGTIVDMMVKVSRYHAVIAGRLVSLLTQSLSYPPFAVTSADFGVRTATSVRYPDVLIDGDKGFSTDLAARAPLFIAEILSPSTLAIDLHQKATEYQSIESLRHYLVLAQDAERAWLWTRSATGWTGPLMLEGGDAEIVLDAVGLTIRLTAIYQGLFGGSGG